MPLNVQKVKWGWMRGAGVGGAPGGTDTGGPPKGGTPTMQADEIFAAWVLGPAARVPRVSTRAGLQGVLFDLDGVLVETAEFHYVAWQRLAEELGVPFGRRMNYGFRGVGRMECLDKLLGPHARLFVG